MLVPDRLRDFHRIEHLQNRPVIERQWAFRFDETAEIDQADQIVRPARQPALAGDEIAEGFFHHRQAVGLFAVQLEIEGLHRAGAIDDHFDGHPFGAHAQFSFPLRPASATTSIAMPARNIQGKNRLTRLAHVTGSPSSKAAPNTTRPGTAASAKQEPSARRQRNQEQEPPHGS